MSRGGGILSRGGAARRRPVWSAAGLLVAYFAFPLELRTSAGVVVGLVLTVVGLGVLGRIMVLELQHLHAGSRGWGIGVLIMVLELLVIWFSLAFFLVNRLAPEQFEGLGTRTDALYFTLSTMTTIGYGDVHAEGQLARLLTCALIVFNVVVVASVVRAHTQTRAAPQQQP
ncbi:potassium channel family protein [Nocardioides pantholopis]|uniref:potassium channel family protein n=1 Tax=Nocardioides pantholopis TaxID=2483798 RepID=UPI000F08C81F|nr:potassium channel family protein [Nocardioides pantholopis]